MKKIIVIIFFAFISVAFAEPNIESPEVLSIKIPTVKKQLNNLNLAKRYIKLGNTWREAGQYDLAKENLEKGMQMLIRYNFNSSEVKYWWAVSQEFIGYYYKDQDDSVSAINAFNESLKYYKQVIQMDEGSSEAIQLLIADLSKKTAQQVINPPEKNNEEIEGLKELIRNLEELINKYNNKMITKK